MLGHGASVRYPALSVIKGNLPNALYRPYHKDYITLYLICDQSFLKYNIHIYIYIYINKKIKI